MVRDRLKIAELNNNLVEAINSRDQNRFHLAPPEIIDWNNVGGFSYTPMGEIYDELLMEDYFRYLNDRNREITVDSLKRCYIYVKSTDRSYDLLKWQVSECIVFETEINNIFYVLTVGEWFKIERSFAEQVREYLNTAADANIDLIPCRSGENERDYNFRMGDEGTNIISLDRNTVNIDGSQIEVCDLLMRGGKLIHVKKWSSSSTLSHLFAQGKISAINLLQDVGFRRETRAKIQEIDESILSIIPEDNLSPESIEIIYAIIDSDNRPLEVRLPFFSKLNMMQTVKSLRSMGLAVTKYKIPYE